MSVFEISVEQAWQVFLGFGWEGEFLWVPFDMIVNWLSNKSFSLSSVLFLSYFSCLQGRKLFSWSEIEY